jgi:hypothetical protein
VTAPAFVSNAQSSNNTAASPQTISLPAGIVAGDLLIIDMAVSASVTPTFPSNNGGWISLRTGGPSFSNMFYYHFCDGTEGTSMSVSFSASVSFAAIVSRISGADNSVPPEVVMWSTGTATASFDPAQVTASWSDVVDNLFACMPNQRGAVQRTSVSTYPTGYNTGQSFIGTTAFNNVAVCFKQANSQSDDPSTFTFAPTGNVTAGTVASIVIRGVGGGNMFNAFN